MFLADALARTLLDHATTGCPYIKGPDSSIENQFDTEAAQLG
jgi:hypothetical protein